MRHARRRALTGVTLTALVLAGCAPDDAAAPATSSAAPPPAADPTEPTVTLTPEPDRSTGTPSAAVGTAADDAVADLAARLGVEPAAVTVVRDVAVTWPDGSVGCPTPGMAYTQALTPGRLVVLEAGGRTVQYHSGGRRGLFLCENPQAPAEVEPES